MATTTGFGDTCEIAVSNTFSSCGTATRSRLTVLSPTAIKALFTGATSGIGGGVGYNENNAYFKHTLEMRMCGIRRSPLYEWLMSSNKPGQGKLINVHRAARGPSLIAPFILGRQQSLWNVDHWAVVGSAAGGVDGGPVEGELLGGSTAAAAWQANNVANSRVLTVESSFAGTMELHADYFLPGKRVHVMSRGGGGALNITQFKIIQAAVALSGLQVYVEVLLDQPGASEASGFASSAFPPNNTLDSGVLFLGVNNVADVEFWCKNPINVNTTKLVPFWYQTKRTTRCIDSKYEELAGHLMENNAWYSIFGDLPMAERNRQDEQRDQVEEMNAFFFGERISANQNLDHWGDLEKIYTAGTAAADGTGPGPAAGFNPGTAGEFMGFRANMIGVLPQLKDCGRVIDGAGAAGGFPLNTFLETHIWDIVRARRSQGRPASEIDIYTDETTADEFMQAFIAYSKVKTGDIARINIEQGFTEWGFPFRRFKLYKPMGVTVNLLTDDYFNDLATAAGYSTSGDGSHGPGTAGLGKFLMVLDLGAGGTIYPAIIATNRKTYNVGDINDLAKIDATYSCVMENPKVRKTLNSKTMTAVVECPANSLIVANFEKIVAGV